MAAVCRWACIGVACGVAAPMAFAQQQLAMSTLPGAADAARIAKQFEAPAAAPRNFAPPKLPKAPKPPVNAKDIRFRLTAVNIEGMEAFALKDIKPFYAHKLGTEISLDELWVLAERITAHYREHRYFLSRAYVPKQAVAGGAVTIRVVEGYIGQVSFDANLKDTTIAQAMATALKDARPVRVEDVESFMLRLNDLPGINRFGVLAPLKGADKGAVELVIEQGTYRPQTRVEVNNHGSRFLGPYQASVSHKTRFIDMQETTITATTSLPVRELKQVAVRHRVPISPSWDAFASAGYVTARPGATLKANDIRSDALDGALGFIYTPIKRWEETLSFTFQLDGKNANGDILRDVPLSRDRVRAVRANGRYDVTKGWLGAQSFSATLSRGLDMFGASDKGAPLNSRAEASPDFTKLEGSYTQQHRLWANFLLSGSVSGQYASGPLLSAEEFGYGGQAFGRAYDPSNIIGDHGISGSLELRYQGLNDWNNVFFAPYLFADGGKVWNEDRGMNPESGTSAGFGVRMSHVSGVSANLGVAWPLTRELQTPLYGSNTGPRFLFDMGYSF